MNKTNGFTLQELLTSLSIISVICALSFPGFKEMLDKEKSATTAKSFLDNLNYARTTAITRNIPVTVCSSINNVKCDSNQDWSKKSILIFQDLNSNGQKETNEQILRIVDFSFKKNSLVWRSLGNKNYLHWQPSGMTYYQNGNFTFCPANRDAHNAKKIILNTAGRLYYGSDKNKDGIQEGTDGKNILC